MVLEKLKLISIADILTICNGICGFIAVICFIKYYPVITIGTGFILLGLVFDGLDGAAARKFGTKHDYGRHLDSISDAFTFVLAPAVLVLVVFYKPENDNAFFSGQAVTNPINILALVAAIFMITFGLKRLWDFTTKGYKLKEFLGLATPALAFAAIVLAHIFDPHRSENNWEFTTYFSLIIIISGSVLMLSKIKYPKIRGRLGAILALGIILSLLSIEIQKWFEIGSQDSIFFYYRIVSFIGASLVVGYVFISPILLSLRNREK
jgi:CDP-diacylglycerol--serine O-phosphatidyltransferase